MNRIFISLMITLLLVGFSGCGQKKSTMHPLVVATPERPSGQEDVIQLTAPKMDTVRVGFIGLGMRGPGAVVRFTHIPGIQIKALCDIRQECVEKAQNILKEAGLPEAMTYYGDENSWKQLCERDDIDLVYVATDWKHHAEMGVYAMEHGKHVAIEVPAAMTLEEIWSLINTSERTRKHCMQLENCVYDFFELTTLNMAQQGALARFCTLRALIFIIWKIIGLLTGIIGVWIIIATIVGMSMRRMALARLANYSIFIGETG